jgi:DNA-binding MarR family transcriptional regulator
MTLNTDFNDNKGKNYITSEDIELTIKLERARSIISRMMELELARHGLTPEQAAILDALESNGGIATNVELANIVIRHYHSVVSIVNRMAKNGLVKKNTVKGQNKFLVTMTEKGETIYRALPRNSISVFFSPLSVEEKSQLNSILQILVSKGRDSLGLDLSFLARNK